MLLLYADSVRTQLPHCCQIWSFHSLPVTCMSQHQRDVCHQSSAPCSCPVLAMSKLPSPHVQVPSPTACCPSCSSLHLRDCWLCSCPCRSVAARSLQVLCVGIGRGFLSERACLACLAAPCRFWYVDMPDNEVLHAPNQDWLCACHRNQCLPCVFAPHLWQAGPLL